MADTTAPETPTKGKRKRKSELEQLQEDSFSATTASSSSVTDTNPWTDRENLEVLRIHHAYNTTGDVKQWVKRLNDKMASVRETTKTSQNPGRTEYEFMSQVRDLQKEGVTVEELEDRLYDVLHPYSPRQEETSKKKRKARK